MKITAIETYLVRPRWCFVEVLTDEGISGWGEPVVEGHAATTQASKRNHFERPCGNPVA